MAAGGALSAAAGLTAPVDRLKQRCQSFLESPAASESVDESSRQIELPAAAEIFAAALFSDCESKDDAGLRVVPDHWPADTEFAYQLSTPVNVPPWSAK